MDVCKLIVESVAIGVGSVAVGCYVIGPLVKKIRASFKDASEETQGHNKTAENLPNDETVQPNYWAKRLDRELFPPKKSHRPDSQPKTPESPPKATPTS